MITLQSFAKVLANASALAAALLISSAAYSQSQFPSKPLSMVVPFPPGGVADIVARAITPAMERALGQSIVVVNKPGAGGALGAAQVATAKPDGHTILMALSSVSTNPEQEKINNRPSLFQLDQLKPIARISKEDMMLAVRPESRYRTVADLVADARERPGKISYASSGVYGVYHVATEMFADAAGIKLLHAPYAGGAPALMALMSGQVDVGLVTRSVGAAQMKAGKLRPLAAWGDTRWDDYPDVPSIRETGYRADYTLWSGIFAPAGTPADATEKLREAVKIAVADPAFRQSMERLGAPLVYLDAPEFEKYWLAESERLITAVRKIGKIQ